jgi:hypothetical protein
MNSNIHFLSHLAQFLESGMVQTKIVEKIKTHILCQTTFSKKSCCLCDVEKYCRARQATDNTTMCITCWIPKVTNKHSEYVMLIPFPLQQTLHEHAKCYGICTMPVFPYFQEPYDLPG